MSCFPLDKVPKEVWDDLRYSIVCEGLECSDNFRAYNVDTGELKQEFYEAHKRGCCEVYIKHTRINGEKWCIGCNYGHYWVNQRRNYMQYQETLRELIDYNTRYTPDYVHLKLQKLHHVFVYGTLKKGGYNSYLLDEAKYNGTTITAEKYNLRQGQNSFPVLMKDDDDTALQVLGESYMCTADEIKELDRLESNGYLYLRVLVPIIVGKGVEKYAWTYLGADYWDNCLDLIDCPKTTYVSSLSDDVKVYNFV